MKMEGHATASTARRSPLSNLPPSRGKAPLLPLMGRTQEGCSNCQPPIFKGAQKDTKKVFRAKAQRACVVFSNPSTTAQDKLREKSFLDPSHSLGMTGRHFAFLASWGEDNPFC